jgi:tetratricopeptide (TPR) repeat protein
VGGCRLPPPPDPNDPNDVSVLQIDVLKRNLQWISDAVNERVAKGEITDAQGRKLLAERAQKLLHSVKIDRLNPVEAFEYGEVFRAAKDWELAEQGYTIAVRWARKSKNEDRRINDTLRLAEAKAYRGKVDEAIALSRSTFDSKNEDKAPILLSVLYEIVPGGESKGKDAELAKLTEDAIGQEELVIVNATTNAGKAFLSARPFHLMKAWDKVASLYRNAGLPDEADKAWQRGSEHMAGHQRV